MMFCIGFLCGAVTTVAGYALVLYLALRGDDPPAAPRDWYRY